MFSHGNRSSLAALLQEYLFDPSILKRLNWRLHKGSFSPPITNHLYPSEGLVMRPLSIDDYQKGYTHLLSELTDVGLVSKDQYESKLKALFKLKS